LHWMLRNVSEFFERDSSTSSTEQQYLLGPDDSLRTVQQLRYPISCLNFKPETAREASLLPKLYLDHVPL